MVSRGQMARRLKSASWLADADTQALFSLLDGEGQRTRAVGGIVRDTLLGVPRDDSEVDFATELLPEEVMARAERRGVAAYPTGIAHGTVTLKLNDRLAEVTTLREDVETDGRHAVVRFGTDWARDAERRDFTINALYADMFGDLFDPLEGAADLTEPVIRFIGDPDRRIAEDRLRVYRFFRFSASHGGERFDPDGLAAAQRAAGTLGGLSAERVGAEMRRLLALPKVVTTLRTMRDAGIAKFDDLTLDRLRSYGIKVMRPNFPARLALILAVEDAAEMQARWRLSNEEMARAQDILTVARLLEELRVHEAAYRYPAALADGVELAAVLAGWTEAGKSAVFDQLAGVTLQPFPINGGDLLARGFTPGPEIGAELGRLERLWIESGFALDREALLKKLKRQV
ncbi:MAG TPA: CCA tRNA nucleotidyltransferase [Devosiaceae bacterium]|nr:CCA tRNA nucleotidyltransferase [Devosiaceae bacterium]